jgi:hypothetical protein
MAKKVIGGIYHYPEEKGFYMLYFNNAMYMIEKTMYVLDQDVEHGFDKNATLLEGYALGAIKHHGIYEWVIRNSGRKHTKDYISDKGPCTEKFFNQVAKFSKSF